MYRKRHLGVEEGNAIDDIVTYEMKKDRGEDSRDDYIAYCRACQLLRIERVGGTPVHPAFRGKAEAQVKSSSQVPPISYMFGPVLPSHMYNGLSKLMVWFLVWAAGCVLIYGAVRFIWWLLSSVMQGFAQIAYL